MFCCVCFIGCWGWFSAWCPLMSRGWVCLLTVWIRSSLGNQPGPHPCGWNWSPVWGWPFHCLTEVFWIDFWSTTWSCHLMALGWLLWVSFVGHHVSEVWQIFCWLCVPKCKSGFVRWCWGTRFSVHVPVFQGHEKKMKLHVYNIWNKFQICLKHSLI